MVVAVHDAKIQPILL